MPELAQHYYVLVVINFFIYICASDAQFRFQVKFTVACGHNLPL